MLRSLARFVIQRGAGSVRRLQLQLGYCGAQDHTEAECLMLAACAAAACSGLQQLTVSCEPILTLSSWLLPLAGSLRSLSTGEFTSAIVAGSLDFLTALQDLELGECSDAVLIPQNAQLPTSLTRLALGNGSDIERMPPQVNEVIGHVASPLLPCLPALSTSGCCMPCCWLALCVHCRCTPPCFLPHACRSACSPTCATCACATHMMMPPAMRRSPGCRCTRFS